MNRRIASALVAAAVVLIAAILVRLGRSDRETPTGETAATVAPTVEPVPEPNDEPIETAEAVLYFPGEENKLYPELRQVAVSDDPTELAATLVRELIVGPTNELLTVALAPEITVTGVYITAEGVAFVDLRAPGQPTPPVTGSTQETLTLYSLVQTLVENIPSAEAVVVLWNGRQPETFGGHIDTTHPLIPDPSLLAS